MSVDNTSSTINQPNAELSGAQFEIYQKTPSNTVINMLNIISDAEKAQQNFMLPDTQVVSSGHTSAIDVNRTQSDLEIKLDQKINQEIERLVALENSAQQRELEIKLEQAITASIEKLTSGPAGLNDFESGLFEKLNEWRAKKGLPALEYDERLQKMAADNNVQQNSKGLGHWAHGGYEVAGWNYQTPEATLQGWIDSPGHYDIISNPHLRYMGPAANGSYQTIHFWT